MSSQLITLNQKPVELQQVVMLVNNTCVNDSRVIKSAEAIAKTGRAVTMICRHPESLPKEKIINEIPLLSF